jgi:hypothetical protein
MSSSLSAGAALGTGSCPLLPSYQHPKISYPWKRNATEPFFSFTPPCSFFLYDDAKKRLEGFHANPTACFPAFFMIIKRKKEGLMIQPWYCIFRPLLILISPVFV